MERSIILSSKKGGGEYKYDLSFIRQVVSEYVHGPDGYRKLGHRYNLSPCVIRSWVLKFSSDLGDPLIVSPPMSEQEKQELEALRKKQKELEKQLELANMKIFGLQTFIDIAEETLQIDLRKKFGSKQSPK